MESKLHGNYNPVLLVMKRIILIILLFGIISGEAQKRSYLDELDEKYTSELFKGDNAYRLAPMYDPAVAGSFNILQYLQGRVPGLTIYGGNGIAPVLRFRSGNLTVFLDEMRVDAQTLSTVNVNDIAYVKVYRQPFAGAVGGGSAIAVYTKDGDEE
jgi:hypothetical protein